MNSATLPKEVVGSHEEESQKPVLSVVEGAKVKNQKSKIENPPPAPDSRPLTPVLVGREIELTQLHSALDKAMQGERQIVFVSGEAGIGKTTLVDAFLAQLRDRVDIRISSGQCVEQYGPGEAYMPLLEAIVRLCRGPNSERRIEDLRRYAPSLLVQLPGLLDPVEHARLQEQLQGTSQERMLREMAQAAELFTPRRGLVLVLEDLHWSDVSTLEWLSYIARRREFAKLLIIGTYRPMETMSPSHPLRGTVQDLLAHRHCEELRVTPLREEAIAEYLYSRFGEMMLPEAAAATLARRTGGNPLFVVNTIDYFVRQGAVTQEAGRWELHLEKVNEIGQDIPDTLRQLIERQVERVSEAEQQLLEVASVAGVEFATVDVAAGLATTTDEVEASCERFARTGQWLRWVGVTELPDGTVSGRYSFLHAMYHEVMSGRIAEIRRIQLHRRIATNKEAVYGERVGEIAAELAVHFEKGREIPRAIAYLERAGRTALRRSANAEVIRHLTHALALLERLPASEERTRQELSLRLTLGTPLLALNGYGALEVRRHYQEARALCHELGDPPDVFPVLWGLWLSHAVAGELSAAEDFGNQLFQCAGHLGDDALAFQAHHALWTTLVARGELTTCQFHIEQGLQMYQTDRHYAQTFIYGGHDPGACCRIHGSFLYWLLGYPDRALQLSEEALVLGKELAHGQTFAWALNGNAMVHQFRGEPQAAQQSAEEAQALSTEKQFALWAAYSPAILGWALIAQGHNEQGLAHTQTGLAALRATGTGLWQSQFAALLASAYGETGQIEEGRRVIDEALAVTARNGERFYEAELYRLKGILTLQKLSVVNIQLSVTDPGPLVPDPRAEAEGYFLKAITIAQEQQAKSWELRAATSLARLWQSQGRNDDARTLLQDIYDWFTEGFDTQDLRDATALLVALGGSVNTDGEKQMNGRTGERENRRREEKISLVHSPGRPVARSFPQATPDAAFRSEGDHWAVSFAGTTCRLKDTRGLHFIAHLLRHPHQEIHAVTLISVGDDINEELADAHSLHDLSLSYGYTEGPSDAGEMLDPHARAAYKQRLSELREELNEAQRFHDVGRSEQLAAEIDFLTHELASAVGLGGRPRRMGSPAERARVNITRAIKIALRKIDEHHPALRQHLATTLKTGTYCSYTPDTRVPIVWQG